MDRAMLLTKNETTSEIKEQSHENHVLYETDGLCFHAAKLIAIEPFFVENEEANDVGFKKTVIKGFYHLKFQEGDNIKTYDVDVNPEVINKVYYYITKDENITNLFPNKEDIKAYTTQALAEYQKSENENIALSLFYLAFFPMMALPLSVVLESYQIPLFFKIGFSLIWGVLFIGVLFPSKTDEKKKYREKEAKLKSFIKQINDFNE